MPRSRRFSPPGSEPMTYDRLRAPLPRVSGPASALPSPVMAAAR